LARGFLVAMPPAQKNPKVDTFLEDKEEAAWKDAFTKLRKIALSCPVTEELKWGKPCYMVDGHNVVLMHGFKEYCALLFAKGALLRDPKGILVQQTKNVQAARQIRFTSAKEVTRLAGDIKAYILEAIEVEKSGAKVEYKQTEDFEVVPEFAARLRSTPSLKAAFEALTPGRQRGYLLHFAGAKQSATRAARIEKCAARIYAGQGLND
jgi:uncharacterized protein YdeI (YjbR/CyaY-like superfamily)